MLAQQEVAFARARQMVGKTIEVLIDRPAGRDEEDGFVARTQSQAPDIDSVTFVHGGRATARGQMVNVKVTDYQAYDLVAEVPEEGAEPGGVEGRVRAGLFPRGLCDFFPPLISRCQRDARGQRRLVMLSGE